MNALVLTIFVLCSLGLSLEVKASPPYVTLEVVSRAQVLFHPGSSACSKDFIPDSPTRAFRRWDGKVELLASHYENWMMIGDTVQSASVNCHAVMSLSDYARALVQGQVWIQAVYTTDGKNVYGLASQDLTRSNEALGCDPARVPGKCWINQIISVRSDDMGDRFSPGPVVATMGEKYQRTQMQQFGYFSTSNIVRWNNNNYVAIFLTARTTTAKTDQESGTCIFRSKDISDPRGWRAWDGTSFSFDPASTAGYCKPVVSDDNGPLRSLTYWPEKRLWIGLTSSRHKIAGGPKPIAGFYTILSADLIHWSPPTLLFQLPLAPRVDSMTDIYSYPSLIDPESKSPNFDTVDHQTALLFYTDHHLKQGNGTLDRDLVYVHIKLN